MRKLSKILVLALALAMLVAVFAITANAAAGQTWTVAGESGLCGSNWDTTDTNNDMTYDSATDSYVKVFQNVKAGTYQFKCAKDHAWNTAYPSSNKSVEVAKDGSTVTVTLKGTNVTVTVEAPACDHNYSITAETVTCTTAGTRTWTCSVCGGSYTEDLAALGHYYEDGKCVRCDATTEVVRVYVENAANWTVVYCYTWDTNPYISWPGEAMKLDSESGLYYYDIPKNFVNVIFSNGSTQSADLKVPTGTATIYNNSTKTWKAPHVHSWSEATCQELSKCECGETQGVLADHNYVAGVCSVCEAVDPDYVAPHVNTLVVGDTNKIVVTGDTLNDYGLPIEWVPFVADEAGFYSFVGDNGALAFIFTAEGGLVSATGAANLEAGTYLICLGNGLVGEFNVAVTKAAWVNALAVGDNKILITDALDNGYGYYIVWVPFEVTEKDNYTFGGENVLALVYDAVGQAVSGTELEVGTYNICIAFLTPATTGVANVTVTKGAGEPVVDDPALVLGDNTVVIDGTTTNFLGNAVAWYTFTPEASGTYTFASEELAAYIYAERNMGAEAVGNGVVELEAGVTYYVLVGKGGVMGEFTVNVSAGGVVVAPNTIVVGENHYVITDALYATGFEFIVVTITEPGVYTITGGAPMKVYMFTTPNADLGTASAGDFAWNFDAMLGEGAAGLAPSFDVTLTEAGTYWFGVNYEYVTDEREFDITLSFKAPLPTDDPVDPVDPQPEEAPELNFFQKIIAWFKDLISKILGIFKKD